VTQVPLGVLSLSHPSANLFHKEYAMKEITRRHFMKSMAVGGAVLGLGGIVFHKPLQALASGKYDIGHCKSLRIKCVSELGWFDTKNLVGSFMKAGGFKVNPNQWAIPFDPKNAAGSCSLIDMETLDGHHHKFLLDTGWNPEYMDECFKREGVDRMLKTGEIEFLIISHEHFDHFFGLETVLKYNPEITIYIPSTMHSEGRHYLRGAEYITASARNGISHRGKLVQFKPGHINKLYKGCAAVAFDLPIIFQVQGEESLYFNVKDKGIVCVTGCCHQNILTFAQFARDKLVDGNTMYGLYGGLHIAPEEKLEQKQLEWIKGMAEYNFRKVACNHCTGLVAVEKMLEYGYAVVKGSGRYGSKSNLYVGNGDEVVFS
jgi:7,8-dihydropterin-6-yl-methyl-4-(beta-D-ribofuranosyl)aminobenzene 5'-phosphate synthase